MASTSIATDVKNPDINPTTASSEIAFRGSCACGRISYTCTAVPNMSQNCLCVTCRKLSGGPHQSFVDVPKLSLTYVDTRNESGSLVTSFQGLPAASTGGLAIYRFSDVAIRAFCAECHTSLAMQYDHLPNLIHPTLGTVDEESIRDEEVKLALAPRVNIFTSQRGWWVGNAGNLRDVRRFSTQLDQALESLEQMAARNT